MSQDGSNCAVARKLYDAFLAGDLKAIYALLDPGVEWELVGPEEVPHFGIYRGIDEVKRFFRPEFLNRIDATVVFHALARDHIINIVDLMLDQVRVQLREHGVNMEVTPEAKEFLAEKGYDPDYGARPLRRVIQDKVEDLLSEELLPHKVSPGDTAVLDVVDGKIVVHSKEMAVSS